MSEEIGVEDAHRPDPSACVGRPSGGPRSFSQILDAVQAGEGVDGVDEGASSSIKAPPAVKARAANGIQPIGAVAGATAPEDINGHDERPRPTFEIDAAGSGQIVSVADHALSAQIRALPVPEVAPSSGVAGTQVSHVAATEAPSPIADTRAWWLTDGDQAQLTVALPGDRPAVSEFTVSTGDNGALSCVMTTDERGGRALSSTLEQLRARLASAGFPSIDLQIREGG